MSSSSFPLAKLSVDELFDVLNKMEFHSFINCRRTTQWLHDFAEKYRSRIKTQLRMKWLTIREDSVCAGRFGKKPIPTKELKGVWVNSLQIFEVSRETVSLIPFKSVFRINTVELWNLEEDAVKIVLDKLDQNLEPCSITIFSMIPYRYNNSLTMHPVFKKIKEIQLQDSFRSPDLSFLSANHEIVSFMCEGLPHEPIIQTIQAIVDGTNSTRTIKIKYNDGLFTSIIMMNVFDTEFVWTREWHETSHFKDRDIEFLPASLVFLSIPMVGGKVGGLCICRQGKYLIFKVFDSMDAYLDRIPTGSNFWHKFVEY